MYIYICNICMLIYIYTHTYVDSIYVYIYLYMYMCIYVYTWEHVHVYSYTYRYIYTCIYVYTCRHRHSLGRWFRFTGMDGGLSVLKLLVQIQSLEFPSLSTAQIDLRLCSLFRFGAPLHLVASPLCIAHSTHRLALPLHFADSLDSTTSLRRFASYRLAVPHRVASPLRFAASLCITLLRSASPRLA